MPIKIPGIPYVIAKHTPMSGPKDADRRRTENPTFIERLLNGGPLPVKIRREKESDRSGQAAASAAPRQDLPQRDNSSSTVGMSTATTDARRAADSAVKKELDRALAAKRKELQAGSTTELNVARDLLSEYVRVWNHGNDQVPAKFHALVSRMKEMPSDSQPFVPTALIESAIRKGSTGTVGILLEPDRERATSRDRNTLALALRNGHGDIAELLLRERRTGIPADAVVAAVQYGSAHTLANVASKAEPTELSDALHDLLSFPNSIRGNHALLQQLIALQPNPNVRIQGSPPLVTAVRNDIGPAVEALLTHPNIDVNTPNRNGQTALHVAASHGHTDFVGRLLDHPGIDVNAVSNGLTALDMARRNGHTEAAQRLAGRGVSGANAIPMEHCRVLGVQPDATAEQITQAYRKLSLTSHPDKGGSNEKFTELKNAYDTAMKLRE